jgi:hypothetical protein
MTVIPAYADLILSQEFSFLTTSDLNRQALINEFLVNASFEVNADWAGSRYGRMVALLAIHRLVLRDRLSAQSQDAGAINPADLFLMPSLGSVSSISGSHGSSSVSLQPIKAGKEGEADYYGQTSFGVEYYGLRRRPIGFVSAHQSRCGC